MTLIEMMFGNFQTEQAIAINRMGAQATRMSDETGKSTSFVDILNSSMSVSVKGSVKNTCFNAGTLQKRANAASVESVSTPVVRSFREANEYNRRMDRTIATDRTGVGKSVEKGILTKDKASDHEAAELSNQENMLQMVAQLLGLEARELQTLLNEAGVTPESFNSLQNISEISADLGKILGLNDSQKKTLEIMLQTAGELLGESVLKGSEQSAPEHLYAASENSRSDIMTAPGQNIAASSVMTQSPVEQQNEQLIGLTSEQLSEQIKMKLDEYGIRLEEGENCVQEDLKALMLPLLEKSSPKVQQAELEMAQISVEASETEITAIGTEEIPNESGMDADSDSEQMASTVRLPHQADAQTAAPNAAQAQPVFASIIQANQTIDTMPVTGQVSAQVNAKEILSQIIEKAQIIMTPDKSEMVMDLKPDSLGKISLKLVTENGIVMAKFVAENQQVKEVLETNMQLLKDSLQKQGLEVQSFSVSVRQDSNRSGWNSSQEDRKGSFAKEPITGVSALAGQIPVFSEAAGKRNPYLRETSTIELSA